MFGTPRCCCSCWELLSPTWFTLPKRPWQPPNHPHKASEVSVDRFLLSTFNPFFFRGGEYTLEVQMKYFCSADTKRQVNLAKPCLRFLSRPIIHKNEDKRDQHRGSDSSLEKRLQSVFFLATIKIADCQIPTRARGKGRTTWTSVLALLKQFGLSSHEWRQTVDRRLCNPTTLHKRVLSSDTSVR